VTSCRYAGRPNSGGSGSPIDQFSANTAPRSTRRAAATIRSGVSMVRQPNAAPCSPQTSHAAGRPPRCGRSSYEGSGVVIASAHHATARTGAPTVGIDVPFRGSEDQSLREMPLTAVQFGMGRSGRMGGMTAPLDGIRVLDLTRVLSGPHCTRMLADLGADVIKVEPPAGDLTRFATPRVNSLSTYFVQQNVGKRNLSVDLDRPEAVELLLALAERCDVLVENFRPGVMARNGLGYDVVAARNPRLVYASITGYGSDGPWVHRRAYAPVVGAETGITKAQGDARGGVYANDPYSHADVYTSLETAAAILAALLQRERTGRGQWIDVSMAQTMLYVNEHLHGELWDGPSDPQAIHSFRPGDYAVVTVASGETVVVSGHPAERGTFELFARAMGESELVHDPRFVDVAMRMAHLEELHAEIAAWAATVPDAHTFEERFAEVGLAVGVLRSARELCDTPWAAARNVTVDVPDRGGGTLRVANAPWRFSDAPDVGVHGEPKYRGEDNRAVLADVLGLTDDELDRLADGGVLSSRVPRRSP
jgi:CoA:oxalate CoA-transferase